ncbi:hypothetical protein FCH28_02815 [Streptomyces piniterrae]|uniref:Uncharacterized protein n=1 Tax=Streptomyces piniterrae TaxID=2571125 RepID=A0A4U0P8M6_9ACTN|nr:hypothetical protein [Streptomyces piniterrae]TJZ59084.1 hypothetical protein FCH28_02815 [Streptomyces piniterrae]
MYVAVEAVRAGKGTRTTLLPFPLDAPYTALAQLILAGLAAVAATACWARRRELGRPGRVAVGYALILTTPGACPRCGHRHSGGHDAPLVHPAASTATRRTRRAAYLLVCGVLPWAGARTIWTLGGDALGITAEMRQQSNSGGSELSLVPAWLTALGLSVYGAFLHRRHGTHRAPICVAPRQSHPPLRAEPGLTRHLTRGCGCIAGQGGSRTRLRRRA